MVGQFFGGVDEEYLAVVGGRYLPLDDITAQVNKDIQTHTKNGIGADIAQTGQTELNLEIVTRRDPMIRNHHNLNKQMFLFSKDQKLTLENYRAAHYNTLGDFNAGHQNIYEIELDAIEWRVEER